MLNHLNVNYLFVSELLSINYVKIVVYLARPGIFYDPGRSEVDNNY
jgi:hypothetical protein